MESVENQTITCEWLRYDVLNYAMQQNFVPVVRKLTLANHSSEDLHQVTVTIKPGTDFAAEWSKTLDVIPAGQSVEVGPVHLPVSGTFLAGLTERLLDRLTLQVEHDGKLLYQEESPVAILAYDQWGGLAAMPEMVAAFVMPNHPAVGKVIHEAGAYLEKWTGNRSFDAYQSKNPNRVRHQAAAIYSALRDYQITYCVAPASFEERGQRVRLADTLFGTRMGNCLDLSLFFASCLEAVGLNPLIIFTDGHAFPGVWLVQETFSEIIQDDITMLTKRLAAGIHEISIAEATLMCAGNQASYQDAESVALSHLANPDSFLGLVDVKRARASSIRPLPIRISTPEGWKIVEEDRPKPGSMEEPGEITILGRPAEVDAVAVSKQQMWERKLLDLTLRNTLLNFRLTKAAMPILYSRLGELEDALAEGKEFNLLSRPQDWENTARSAELFHSISKDDPLNTLLQEEFANRRLRIDVGERELFDKATHLYRSARLSLEENGANTLYLALGLLRWYETTASEMPRYAPIILIPVDLVRKTSSSGYVLRARDEEPQINITLLEMLRQDFGISIGGLDPLPRDDKGIDINGIFTTIRHVVMHLPRWDIVESAYIGLFSFSRFVMWNDIRNRSADLAKNKVVASLISGKLEWDPGMTFPEADQLDELYAPDELLLPISADSSQMTAISAALQDKSFVLHGPPGTGKSQTITNLIAASLAHGKTVLFVAEKMAALNVVQKRLEQIGLGPFCLELHSNKSTKKAVLEQLRRTLEAVRTTSPEDWKRQAERLAATRKELNGYVKSLHKPYSFGASLYDAIAHYEKYKSAPDAVSIDPGVAGKTSSEGLAAWRDLVRDLYVAGVAAGHPHGHVWSDVQTSTYTPALRSQVEELLAKYAKAFDQLKAAFTPVQKLVNPDLHHPDAESLAHLAWVVECLAQLPDAIPAELLKVDDLEHVRGKIAQAIRHGTARDDAKARVMANYKEDVLAFDAALALSEWRKANMQWFVPKFLKQHRIYKMLCAWVITAEKPPKSSVEETLQHIVRYQTESESLKAREADVSRWLGALWNQGQADWEAVKTANEWVLLLHERLLRLFQDRAKAKEAMGRTAMLLESGKESFLRQHFASMEHFLAVYRECKDLEEKLAKALQLDFRAVDGRRKEEPWFTYRARQIALWSQHVDKFRDWCNFRHVRQRAIDAGLTSVVSAYENGALQHEDVIPAFERAWWRAAIQFILEAAPQLASFSGRLFEERIKAFQETLDRFEQLTREEIAARLFANVPPVHHQAAATSEMGILLRAIRSGGRGISLRKLFEQISGLLTRLCPCMLMSPMSVAQFLDPKYAPFDLVVFDEASQLPTSEAVGAMARGRNVIVVGDPKQLPPTSFFMSASNGEIDADASEDLESILDDCLAIGMPQEHLLWHYRSRHESLIAFSNRHFYENKLLTVPSPFERKSSVKWHPVEGYYDRGKTKQNRSEAAAVVEEIKRRLRSPELRQYSIGVVTFNAVQQTLIEDLLESAFRQEPSLEEAALQMKEPIFVKNLENVQGDERDVILFSIGYGPDQTGKVVLNFGPLNRDGGWRRLNVAVSRARYEMHVFSSLRADHLDVTRTQAEGVRVLRAFLEYAEKGVAALGRSANQLEPKGALLEHEIAKALEREGYKVDVHVGVSGFRIDLAIVHPEDPDVYVLGVLCDGVTYKSGKTVRDREVLRGQVLRQLGWHIHQVWSLDWLDNPNKELQRIVEAIQLAKQAGIGVQEPVSFQPEMESSGDSQSATSAVFESAAMAVRQPDTERDEQRLKWATTYSPVHLPAVGLPAEAFYSPDSKQTIQQQIHTLIEGEGPISRTLLVRKVLQVWGIARAGSRIDEYFTTLLGSMKLNKTVWEGTEFYWPSRMVPAQYEVYRIAKDEQDRRSAEDLPPEEIANAVKEVLFIQGSLPQEDLIRETVKLLGYARTGSALEKAVSLGIRYALDKGVAEWQDGRLRLGSC
jgi:hypothetical protein